MKKRITKRNLIALLMRTSISLMLIVLVAGITYGGDGLAQDLLKRAVSVDADQRELKAVLAQLGKSAKIRFSYSPALIRDRKVSLTMVNQPLEDVLIKLLRPLRIQYEVAGDYIILNRESNSTGANQPTAATPSTSDMASVEVAKPQDRLISGTVTDEKGGALPGVNILIKGTTRGTTTNADGSYRLNVPEGTTSTLIFSLVGYTSQEVATGNRSTVDLQLQPDDKTLNEVVVVGYGTQDRRNVTGAVVNIKAESIKDLPVASLDQKLSGQIAGVQVSQATGAPGGGSVIRIRGSGSIGAGDDPLYVIDGFPITNTYSQAQNPLATLNPNDIESITVLKDAASTSIYGSRGSNGVIIVNTKRAKAGQSSIEFSAYGAAQVIPMSRRLKMLNASEYAQYRYESAQERAAYLGIPFDENMVAADYRNYASLGEGTKWYDEVTRTAPMQDYNLTITKGTQNARLVASAGYFNQQGTVKYTGLERYSLRVNAEANIGKKVVIGINLAPSYTLRKGAGVEGGPFNSNNSVGQAVLASPVVPVYNSDGTFTQLISTYNANRVINYTIINPLNFLTNSRYLTTNTRLLSSIFANWQILPGLMAKTTFNVDIRGDRADTFIPSTVPANNLATGSNGTSNSLNWLNENTINYDKEFGNHRLSALAGFTVQNERIDNFTITGSNYPNNVVYTINAANTLTSTGDINEWRLISYLARVNYSFKDRYILGATIRQDGSSRFGANNRYGIFPSASAAWHVSDEAFFPRNTVFEDLKLRVSYGLAGNNNIGNYTYIPSISTVNYTFNGALASGASLGSLGNNDLGWEQSQQTDIGLEVSLLRGRIYFTGEWYNRITQEMLQALDVPYSSGFATGQTNLGKVRNHGFEFAINTRNFTTGKFRWNTDFNIAFNRNKVLDLGPRTSIISVSNITVVGQPMGMFYTYVFDGIFQSQEELNRYPKVASGQAIGTTRYKDTDGDGVITPNDRTITGNPYPTFTWGMTNRFNYAGFDLNILLAGSQGNKVINTYKQWSTNLDAPFNVEREVLDHWRSPSNPGSGILPTVAVNTELARDYTPNYWIADASFLAVRNVTLGYNLKLKTAGTNARVYFSAQNPVILTSYPGNPEVNTQGNNSLRPGNNNTGYPLASTYTLGLNLKF